MVRHETLAIWAFGRTLNMEGSGSYYSALRDLMRDAKKRAIYRSIPSASDPADEIDKTKSEWYLMLSCDSILKGK